ncbi:hypothetical protein BIV25_20985 [Streptomyces sp. MUSC 14]|uniref:twin-arginine translocase TatA/TatE family subunit n=1 Tax=Streptomyces sp. MUSC 14 TaxID=1354889 RepID=UPI0008F5D44F|nr:twin-arginine translocase TatA/TatE family subunit [Streptomyces sp. MUSC 14]OIJ95103.1 hypothetical protein BIV25_20985 [Streptomyces sp. MUSC 14]
MFFDVSPLDLLTLALLAVLLFGPDKLPEVVQKVAGFVRTVRAFADSARDEVRAELGPEFRELEEIRSALDPRAELSEVAAAVNGEPARRPGSRAASPQDAPAGTYDPDATRAP